MPKEAGIEEEYHEVQSDRKACMALIQGFLDLERDYTTLPTTTEPEMRIDYLYREMIDHILNAIKALEYHARDDYMGIDDRKDIQKNKNWRKAIALLRKYGVDAKTRTEVT